MGFFNAVAACYYSFNQCLILQAEISIGAHKTLDICGFEDLKRATIPQVAEILNRAANKIIINTHDPLRTELNMEHRVSQVDLDLNNVQQYDDLLDSLNHENKLSNSCNISYEKQYKKNSLYLLLKGGTSLLKPTFAELYSSRKNRKEMQSLFFSFSERQEL